jgi:hypothetical protein
VSIETWKAEFMPRSANQATSTWLEAVDHSLAKYKGFTKENLEKHDLGLGVIDMYTDSDSCACCRKADWMMSDGYTGCRRCPIGLLTVDELRPTDLRCVSAVSSSMCPSRKSPFYDFSRAIYRALEGYEYPDPQPMIALLERARQYVIDHNM